MTPRKTDATSIERIRLSLAPSLLQGAFLAVGAICVGAAIIVSRIPVLLGEGAGRVSPQAAIPLSRVALAAGNLEAAEGHAWRALSQSPLNAAALRSYALAVEAQGRIEDANQAWALTSALGWRDTVSQMRLFEGAVRSGDFEAAIRSLDALARRRVATRPLTRLIAAVGLEPQARDMVISRLLDDPPWRAALFESASESGPNQVDQWLRFLAEFESAGGTPRPEELEPLISHMVALGRFDEARALWLRANNLDETSFEHIWNADFTRTNPEPPNQGPFEWQLSSRPGLEAYLADPAEGAHDGALIVHWRGLVQGPAASQVLTLPPGGYRLTVETFDTKRGSIAHLRWDIHCLGGQVATLGAGNPQYSEGQGNRILASFTFSVPEQCRGQRLELSVTGEGAGEHEVSIDSLGLARL